MAKQTTQAASVDRDQLAALARWWADERVTLAEMKELCHEANVPERVANLKWAAINPETQALLFSVWGSSDAWNYKPEVTVVIPKEGSF